MDDSSSETDYGSSSEIDDSSEMDDSSSEIDDDSSSIDLCFDQYINIRGVSDEAHTYYHNYGKLTNRFY